MCSSSTVTFSCSCSLADTARHARNDKRRFQAAGGTHGLPGAGHANADDGGRGARWNRVMVLRLTPPKFGGDRMATELHTQAPPIRARALRAKIRSYHRHSTAAKGQRDRQRQRRAAPHPPRSRHQLIPAPPPDTSCCHFSRCVPSPLDLKPKACIARMAGGV
jgi:hypothetical protein